MRKPAMRNDDGPTFAASDNGHSKSLGSERSAPRFRAAENPRVSLFLGVALALLASVEASAAGGYIRIEEHTKVVLEPERTVVALVHDWVYDRPMSEWLKQQYLKPGESPTRENFATQAQSDAKSLTRDGYFTKFEIDGTRVEFMPMTEYWMGGASRPSRRLPRRA